MKNTFKKGLFKSLLTSAVLVSALGQGASVLAQSYEELIGASQYEIDALTAEQAAIYDQLNQSYAEIEALKAEAEGLVQDLSRDDALLAELEEEIQTLEEIIAKREELLTEQARKVQVSAGSQNYLNYIASAKSVSDLVGRADVINKMIDANKNLIAVQKADKDAIEDNQAQLEAAKADKLDKMDQLTQLKADLATQTVYQEEAYHQLTTDISLASQYRDALVAEQAAYLEAQWIAEQEAIAAANQAELEASVAAAAQADSPAELQANYDQALAEAEALDAAIAQAQAEADAAAQAEAQAQAEAEAARFAAEEAAAYAASLEAQAQAAVEAPEWTAEPALEEESGEEVWQAEELVEEPVEEAWTEEAQAEAEAAVQAEAEAQWAAQAEAEALVAQEAEAARLAAEQAAQEAAAAEAAAAEASVANQSAQANVAGLIANAEAYIGTPYVWGGKTPAGFDCSGFVQYVFQQTYGIDVGGWTGAQEHAGTRISTAEARPGDLYFWGDPGSTYHVAIATGGGEYIHAVQPGTSLRYGSSSSFTPDFAVRVLD